jgi:hypothetical protein
MLPFPPIATSTVAIATAALRRFLATTRLAPRPISGGTQRTSTQTGSRRSTSRRPTPSRPFRIHLRSPRPFRPGAPRSSDRRAVLDHHRGAILPQHLTMFVGRPARKWRCKNFSDAGLIFHRTQMERQETRTPHFVGSKRSRWILQTAVAAASQSGPAALRALAGEANRELTFALDQSMRADHPSLR